MQETTIRNALKLACKSSIEEATMHAQLIESQLVYLEQLGDLPDGGLVLYEQARQVRTWSYRVPASTFVFCLLVATQHCRSATSLSE